MNKETLFNRGRQAFLDGVDYKGNPDAAWIRGWDHECRMTKCNFSNYDWNRSGAVRTSSDLRTLFV